MFEQFNEGVKNQCFHHGVKYDNHDVLIMFYTHHDIILVISWHVSHGCHETAYDHDIKFIEDIMIMPCLSWKIIWSCYGRHRRYREFAVLWTLIIDAILVISTQLAVLYYFTRSILKGPFKSYPIDISHNEFWPNNSQLLRKKWNNGSKMIDRTYSKWFSGNFWLNSKLSIETLF